MGLIMLPIKKRVGLRRWVGVGEVLSVERVGVLFHWEGNGEEAAAADAAAAMMMILPCCGSSLFPL